jgi:hypothetical protein
VVARHTALFTEFHASEWMPVANRTTGRWVSESYRREGQADLDRGRSQPCQPMSVEIDWRGGGNKNVNWQVKRFGTIKVAVGSTRVPQIPGARSGVRGKGGCFPSIPEEARRSRARLLSLCPSQRASGECCVHRAS